MANDAVERDAHVVVSHVLGDDTSTAFKAPTEEHARAVFDRAKEIIEELRLWRD